MQSPFLGWSTRWPGRCLNAAMRIGRYAAFAWGVLGFTLLVILWGAFVRASGSGAGCGSHWPLCNGEVVPRAPALATLIEFAHRITSGLALMLIGGLIVGAWRGYPRGHAVRRGAALSALFIVTEALDRRRPGAARACGGRYVAGARVLGRRPSRQHVPARRRPVADGMVGLRRASRCSCARRAGSAIVLAAALAGVLLLGVSGAITALGDTLFPVATLAEGKALTHSDSAHLFVRLRIWHPMLAVVVGCASRRRRR